MMLWQLFTTFFKIGLISFGGGYAMIPLIETEIVTHEWMTVQEFTNIIAVAGMSPGPMATNIAIFIGYQTAGIFGATVSALGMLLPSLIIILIISSFFTKANQNKYVQYAFYGLRPIVVGLIIYATITFAIANKLIVSFSFQTFSSIIILILSFLALIKFRIHPALVILVAGISGIIIF